MRKKNYRRRTNNNDKSYTYSSTNKETNERTIKKHYTDERDVGGAGDTSTTGKEKNERK
jgi:hypothetical protein